MPMRGPTVPRGAMLSLGPVLVAVAALVPSPASGRAEPRDLAAFTPASLLRRGETEVVILNNVYTQTRFYDDGGERQPAGGRSTWATMQISWTRGLSQRLNAGLDASVRGVDDETVALPDPPAETDRRIALAWIGLRAEVAPWRGTPGVSLETAVRVPLARNLDGADGDDTDDRPESPFLDSGDATVLARLRWDQGMGPRAYFYGEAGGELRVDRDGPRGGSTPVRWMPHILVGDAVTLYAVGEVTPFWGGAATGDWSSQVGAGGKWRPRRGVELDASAGTFPGGRNQGAGHALTVGLRIVR